MPRRKGTKNVHNIFDVLNVENIENQEVVSIENTTPEQPPEVVQEPANQPAEQQPITEQPTAEQSQQAENQNVENIVLSKENYNKVIKILKSLSTKQRMVFILKHFYGYKYDEISKIMHCPIGTVRSCLHNAIGNIIKQLEKEGMYDE